MMEDTTIDPFNLAAKRKILSEDEPLPRTMAAALSIAQDDYTTTAAVPSTSLDDPHETRARSIASNSVFNSDDSEVQHQSEIVKINQKAKLRLKSKEREKKNIVPATNLAKSKIASTCTSAAPSPFKDLPLEPLMTLEEATLVLTQSNCNWLSDEMLKSLALPKWQDVHSTLNLLQTKVQQLNAADIAECSVSATISDSQLDALIMYFHHVPSYTTSNLNITRGLLQLLASLLRAPGCIISNFSVNLLINPLLLRLNDKKTAEMTQRVLLSTAEASSARLLIQCIHQALHGCKVVRTIELALQLIALVTKIFSVQAVDVRRVVAIAKEFLLNQISAPNGSAIRVNSIAILSEIYAQLGSSSRSFLLEGLHEHEAVVSTLSLNAEPNCVPVMRGRASHAHLEALNIDALTPRRELSSLLSEATLNNLKDQSWKSRLAGLETVATIIEANQKRVSISAKDGGGFVTMIASNLSDSNKIILIKTVSVLHALIISTQDGLAKHAPKMLPIILCATSDSKKAVKDEAMAFLSTWLQRHGLHGANATKAWRTACESHGTRFEAFVLLNRWLDANSSLLDSQLSDISELIVSCVDALLDKSLNTRNEAERFLFHALAHGFKPLIFAASQRLKPAHALQVQPVLERIALKLKEARSVTHHLEKDKRQLEEVLKSSDSEERAVKNDIEFKDRSSTVQTPAISFPSNSIASSGAHLPLTSSNTSHRRELPSLPTTTPGSTAIAKNGEPASAFSAASSTSSSSSSSSSTHPFLLRIDTLARTRRVQEEGKKVKHFGFKALSDNEKNELVNQLGHFVLSSLQDYLFASELPKVLLAIEFFTDLIQVVQREDEKRKDKKESLAACHEDEERRKKQEFCLRQLHAIDDLLCRWIAYRLQDACPRLALALLELLELYTRSIHESGLVFVESEVAVTLLPTLQHELGHSASAVRSSAANLLLALRERGQCTPTRLGACLIKALDHKNKRCANEACSVLLRFSQSRHYECPLEDLRRAFPFLARMVVANDAVSRTNALAALVIFYEQSGAAEFAAQIDALSSTLPPAQFEKIVTIIGERVKRAHIADRMCSSSSSVVSSPPSISSSTVHSSASTSSLSTQAIAKAPRTCAPSISTLTADLERLQTQFELSSSSIASTFSAVLSSDTRVSAPSISDSSTGCGSLRELDNVFQQENPPSSRLVNAFEFLLQQLQLQQLEVHEIWSRMASIGRFAQGAYSAHLKSNNQLRSLMSQLLQRLLMLRSRTSSATSDGPAGTGFNADSASVAAAAHALILLTYQHGSLELQLILKRTLSFDEELKVLTSAYLEALSLLPSSSAPVLPAEGYISRDLLPLEQMLLALRERIHPAKVNVSSALTCLHHIDLSLSASSSSSSLNVSSRAPQPIFMSVLLQALIETNRDLVITAAHSFTPTSSIRVLIDKILATTNACSSAAHDTASRFAPSSSTSASAFVSSSDSQTGPSPLNGPVVPSENRKKLLGRRSQMLQQSIRPLMSEADSQNWAADEPSELMNNDASNNSKTSAVIIDRRSALISDSSFNQTSTSGTTNYAEKFATLRRQAGVVNVASFSLASYQSSGAAANQPSAPHSLAMPSSIQTSNQSASPMPGRVNPLLERMQLMAQSRIREGRGVSSLQSLINR